MWTEDVAWRKSRVMSVLADARIVMWEGSSLWVIERSAPVDQARTEPHAHHAIQISFALGGEMRFWAGDLYLEDNVVVVAPDAVHMFAGSGTMAHLFADPDSRHGRTIARRLLQGADLASAAAEIVEPYIEPILAGYRARVRDDAALVAVGRTIVQQLTGGEVGDVPDLRVRKLMAAAAGRLGESISLSDFEGLGGLSASRLRHLFVEQTGLPFRTYLLWLRLTRAVQAIAAGAPLTSAAHDAGFADSAHFSRTFKRMFGISPTALRIS
jgi:AraC family transcriptional regulator